MAFCRLVFPLLVLSVVQIYAVKLPVFIWGDVSNGNVKSSPLSTLSATEFKNVLSRQHPEDTFTVTFIEEKLSVVDFTLKDSNGVTIFPYLRKNVGDSVYLPSVEDPVELINNFADSTEADHVKLTEDGLSKDIMEDGAKFLFISLKDAREGENRMELLRRHNDFMEDIVTKLLGQHNRVVAIYTAYNPSWTPVSHSRERREVTVSEGSDYNLDGLHIYVSAMKIQRQNDTTNLTDLTSSSSFFGEGNMTTTLNFPEGALTLKFRESNGYWYFETVDVQLTKEEPEELFIKTDDVYALLGFSYRCGQEVVFASVNETKPYKLTFEDIEVQPFFSKVNNTDFGESFNCVGFFSVAIWSGLFVVFILLAITFFGIMMMLDIRTMDRFDDPKGKTITINAGE